ncbi:MAG: phosphate ABC transporter ATP-binding protein [Symploca sp. SIO3E6]|nr:phosphate ABC transporter ATP-binding protein [Caldora sp. SIO3E6]
MPFSTPEQDLILEASLTPSTIPSPPDCLFTQQLSLSYGKKTTLKEITFSIPKGGITALIGPSGCGKTSFLYCLNRLTDLIPNCQVSGKVYLEDLDIFHPNTDTIALRRRVGMILQKPNPFPFSIWRNIAFPLKEHGIKDRQQIDAVVQQVLSDVHLWDEVKDRLHTSALKLSGGQKQRLCIARTLALRPEVLLMDEPCSALDPISSGAVEDLITSLRGKYTVVIVTHNLAQARRVADYVGVFWVDEDQGRLIEAGSVQQVFENPQNPVTAAYVKGHRC